MPFESLTDEKILDLVTCPKQLINPQARTRNKEGHMQVNYRASANDGSENEFEIYKRQNLREGMEDDFSCGIAWIAPSGETLTLKRYNGPGHQHANQIENVTLDNVCHIHLATERYIQANRKAEGYADPSDRYITLDGAFACLVKDCKISGIKTTPDDLSQQQLF